MTRSEIQRLLKIRDALLNEDIAAAYRELYLLADPEMIKGRPWEEWERIVSGDIKHQVEIVQ